MADIRFCVSCVSGDIGGARAVVGLRFSLVLIQSCLGRSGVPARGGRPLAMDGQRNGHGRNEQPRAVARHRNDVRRPGDYADRRRLLAAVGSKPVDRSSCSTACASSDATSASSA